MRRLLFLSIISLLIASCNQSRTHLNKAEALLGIHYDSMLYHLIRIDYTSLTPSEQNNYHYLRMGTDISYLMSFTPKELDSLMSTLKKAYPLGHSRAFNTRSFELLYHYQKLENPISADSLANQMNVYAITHKDSSRWYFYKQLIKTTMTENDSAIHYLKEAELTNKLPLYHIYKQLGVIYHSIGQKDSAIHYHMKSIEMAEGKDIFLYSNHILDLLAYEKNYQKAWDYLKKLRARMKRKDIPYINLMQGDLWMEMHCPDSAMKHYKIASESENTFIASQAFTRIGNMYLQQNAIAPAIQAHSKAIQATNHQHRDIYYKEQRAEFESLKQQNLLNELKVERQRHIITILGLALLVVIIIGFFIILWFHRKRELEHKQFLLDNQLLKQQEELSLLREKEAVLREKDALMREELFKRMKVAEKLPILDHNQSIEEGKHINLSETDWSEIRLMLDSSYPNFIKNLKDTCPTLSEKDINFCCLIKINLSLQSLADIYCISTNSISRKKLRLKEKLRLPKEESLSQYLKRLGSPV